MRLSCLPVSWLNADYLYYTVGVELPTIVIIPQEIGPESFTFWLQAYGK